MLSTSPIAVLDTGAGGLSVVRAIQSLLPHEDIHYFADTAHMPYGSKSPELIKHLAIKMALRLHELSSCKVLVVACHTISCWSLTELQALLPIPVIGMIDASLAGLKKLIDEKDIRSVGIISTSATVLSSAYKDAWPTIDPHNRVVLNEKASSLLVSLVEDIDIDFNNILPLVEQFMPAPIKQSDALLIGCTHFSALIDTLKAMAKSSCTIIDGADLVTLKLKDFLQENDALHQRRQYGRTLAYVSDNPQRFSLIARRFIKEDLLVEWLRDYARL